MGSRSEAPAVTQVRVVITKVNGGAFARAEFVPGGRSQGSDRIRSVFGWGVRMAAAVGRWNETDEVAREKNAAAAAAAIEVAAAEISSQLRHAWGRQFHRSRNDLIRCENRRAC